MIRTKKELQNLIKDDKKRYETLKLLLEIDLEDLKNLLCVQQNLDTLRALQGQVFKVKEYLTLLT